MEKEGDAGDESISEYFGFRGYVERAADSRTAAMNGRRRIS